MSQVTIVELSVRQVAALTDAVLVDVRETDEWHAGHAPKAVHIPLGELAARVGELPGDARIVCICRSGNRSGRATAWLRAQGFQAQNMTGGMGAWAAAGLAVVDDAGQPGAVA